MPKLQGFEPVGNGQAACGLSLVCAAGAGLAAGALAAFFAGTAFFAGAGAAFFAGAGAAFFAGAGAAFFAGAGAAFFAGAGAAFFAGAGAAFLAGAGAAFFAGAGAAFFAGAGAAFFAGAGAAFFAGAGAAFFAGAGAAFTGAAFFAGAGFFAVAIKFSLIDLQRALHANKFAQSDAWCWALPSTMNSGTQFLAEQMPCAGLWNWVLSSKEVYSQDSAPPDWYSMTRVSKKLRSFLRSIISLIQGKGFSSLGNKVSSPICVARRLAM